MGPKHGGEHPARRTRHNRGHPDGESQCASTGRHGGVDERARGHRWHSMLWLHSHRKPPALPAGFLPGEEVRRSVLWSSLPGCGHGHQGLLSGSEPQPVTRTPPTAPVHGVSPGVGSTKCAKRYPWSSSIISVVAAVQSSVSSTGWKGAPGCSCPTATVDPGAPAQAAVTVYRPAAGTSATVPNPLTGPSNGPSSKRRTGPGTAFNSRFNSR